MEYSTLWSLKSTIQQPVYSEPLQECKHYTLHTLGVHPIHNQFWQYSPNIIYHQWLSHELHQLILEAVHELLHWLLKYLNASNINDQFDNRLSSVEGGAGYQPTSKLLLHPTGVSGGDMICSATSEHWHRIAHNCIHGPIMMVQPQTKQPLINS